MSEPSLMIESYQLDQAYNVYDVLDSIYNGIFADRISAFQKFHDPVTQGDIDEVSGFDDYQLFVEKKLTTPLQPDNPYYMKGWLKHEHDLFKYLSWESFCK